MTGSALRRWTLYATLLLGEKFFFRKGEGFRGGDRGRVHLGPEAVGFMELGVSSRRNARFRDPKVSHLGPHLGAHLGPHLGPILEPILASSWGSGGLKTLQKPMIFNTFQSFRQYQHYGNGHFASTKRPFPDPRGLSSRTWIL